MTKHRDAMSRRRAEQSAILAALNDGWSHNQEIAEATGLRPDVTTKHLISMKQQGLVVSKFRGCYHVALGVKVIPEPTQTWKDKMLQYFSFGMPV